MDFLEWCQRKGCVAVTDRLHDSGQTFVFIKADSSEAVKSSPLI